MATLKGQNFRVLVEAVVVAEATNCTITYTNNTSDASTKDDVGMSARPKITSRSWQVQVDSMNVTDIGALITTMKAGTAFQLDWYEVSTADNATIVDNPIVECSGDALLTDLTANFNDREYSTKNIQFTGTGPLYFQ